MKHARTSELFLRDVNELCYLTSHLGVALLDCIVVSHRNRQEVAILNPLLFLWCGSLDCTLLDYFLVFFQFLQLCLRTIHFSSLAIAPIFLSKLTIVRSLSKVDLWEAIGDATDVLDLKFVIRHLVLSGGAHTWVHLCNNND